MNLEVGDFVVIRDGSNLQEAFDSFYEKWKMGVLTAMVAPTLMEMATEMASTSAVREKQTGFKIEPKYFGCAWKPFDQIVGIVTEVNVEDHSDFDVIKIREQTGGTRYCRRYIIERAQEAI